MTPQADPLQAALERFGLQAFRPGQREVISQIVEGQDCLCVMPTGGGKSLCFQLPTVVRSGLTIVVSPLIALMKDQVDALQRRGISATLINSSLTVAEQNQRLQWVAEGRYSLVYVAPERLRNARFMEVIRTTPIQLLAVDEAHCISEWGHDFRPDYARIGQFRQYLGGVQTVALTATATTRVRQDIVNILQLKQPQHFITGFARTNLYFTVMNCRTDSDKEETLFKFLKENAGSGIIYAATRKKCEELVELLSKRMKMSVGAYHAGLTIEQRRFIQEQFMKGELRAIVATNAFGMGIDKSDLRFVVHYNIPGSLEAYYQEAGRAGRDGKPSQCLLLYAYQDRYVQEFFIENIFPPVDAIKDIYDFLYERPEDPIELTQQEIREVLELTQSAEAVGTALQILSRTGVLERLEAGTGLAMVRISSDLPTLVDLLPRNADKRRRVLHALERAVGDRRYDAVYVHPRWLMQQTELEREPLMEALRELNKLEMVEYVPPFRGRAIHFRKRGIPFEQLAIDFANLNERKKAEYAKLERVIDFAQGKCCRQLAILEYFGDVTAKPCGMCDRCMNRAGWIPLEVASDGVIAEGSGEAGKGAPEAQGGLARGGLKLVLGIVLRAVQRVNGRLGKNLVAQVLVGSTNAKVARLKLDRLDFYGALKSLKQAESNLLLDNLLAAGLLEQREESRFRPTLWVSKTGEMVLKGEEAPAGIPFPKGLLKKLEAIEAGLAGGDTSTGGVDRVGVEVKSGRGIGEVPRGESRVVVPQAGIVATGEAKGVEAAEAGRRELRVDGSAVAGVKSRHEEEGRPELDREVVGAGRAEPHIEEALEDWHWTWRLVTQKFALFECAAIRRKTMEAILQDLIMAVKAGRGIELHSLLDRVTFDAAERFLLDPACGSVAPLHRHPSLIPLLLLIQGKLRYNSEHNKPTVIDTLN